MKKEINLPVNKFLVESKNDSNKILMDIGWGIQYQIKVANHLQKNKKKITHFLLDFHRMFDIITDSF